MRSRVIKWLFPFLALFLPLTSGLMAQAYVYANDTTGQYESGRKSAPTATPRSTGAVSSYTVITAPAMVLPSPVYVLHNREIVTERPLSEGDNSPPAAPEFSLDEKTSHSATLKASVTVAPARRIVVDKNDRIVEIYSNTTGTKRSYYSLRVKELSWQGAEHPLTPEILAQYNRLLGEIDWGQEGRVY